jgi:dipeptidyl-peptidase-4
MKRPTVVAWAKNLFLALLFAGCAGAPDPTEMARRPPAPPSPAPTGAQAPSTVPPPAFASLAEASQALEELSLTRSYTRGNPSHVTVSADGAAVYFLRSDGKSRVQSLYAFDVAARREIEVASAQKLLSGKEEHLTPEERARRERQRVVAQGITSFSISDGGQLLLVPVAGSLFVLERQKAEGLQFRARRLPGVEGVTDPKLSPDGRRVSFIKNHDLYVHDLAAGKTVPVTTGGTDVQPHGEAEFVAQEEMGRHSGYYWSPDARAIAYQITDHRGVERLHIADPTRPYVAPESWFYPRAGQANAKVQLAIATVPARAGAKKKPPGTQPALVKPVRVKWDQEKFPYLATVRWPKKGPLCILVQRRDQREQVLLAVDPASGATRPLHRETDDAWINLRQSMPRWLADGSGFLWMTEADGEWRLWLHEPAGQKKTLLNPGQGFRLRRVLHVDLPRREVIVSGAERPPEEHIYALSLDGKPARKLTQGVAHHGRVYAFSRPPAWATSPPVYVATRESLRKLQTLEVRRVGDDTVVGSIASAALRPPRMPSVELTRVGPSGEYDAALVRPRNFQPGRKYPVIVAVYGGPSEGVVHALTYRYFRQQWFADHGFIVVSSDNRGIQHRGRAWERAIRGNFGDIPLDDQVAALKALGARYPELDLHRVGIMGWSFGGTMSALAVLKRGDVFHAACAGAPVVEWTDYDTHYTERYLGHPSENADGYKRSNLLTYAPGLARPLLLIHGTADDNVYFGNSLKLDDALFRNGRPFELVPLASITHMVPDPATNVRLDTHTARFFQRHLAGATPPAQLAAPALAASPTP